MNKIGVVLLSSLFLTGILTLPSMAHEWPMFRHDPHHTGFSQSLAPDMVRILWNATIPPVIHSSPSFNKEWLYIGSEDGNLYCFDGNPLGDGDIGIPNPEETNYDLIWTFPTGGAIRSSPALYDDKVFFGSSDGKIYCIYACIGTEIWSYQTGDAVLSSPTVVDDKVYVGSSDGKIYCLDARDGTHIWERQTQGAVRSSPAVVTGRVYIGSDDCYLYCLYASNGTIKWQYHTRGKVSSSPAVINDTVLFGSEDGNVYCLQITTGIEDWKQKIGENVTSSPALAYEKVYIGSDDHFVYCLNLQDGTKHWRYKTNGPVVSSPAVADGKIYVGSMDRSLYCFDAFNGSLIWRYDSGAAISSSPAIFQRRLYAASEQGDVFCIRNCNPPLIPEKPSGPQSGLVGERYTYISRTTDPEGDPIYFLFDWGDGNQSGWLGPFGQQQTVNVSYRWNNEGEYDVTVKAKDSFGNESKWSEPLTVRIMILSITNIRGGLGVHAKINNIGERKIWDIHWNITVEGGLLKNPANAYFDGSITGLSAGESVDIKSGSFFQVGRVKITVALQDRAGDNMRTKTVDAFAFGFILLVLRG